MNTDAQRLALRGIDPVSYFSTAGPRVGAPSEQASYDGATYRFATAEHKQQFVREPARYAPAYGGWCAAAMADGRFVDADPKNFRILKSRVYLFYRFGPIDAARSWDDHPEPLARNADACWAKFVDQENSRQ